MAIARNVSKGLAPRITTSKSWPPQRAGLPTIGVRSAVLSLKVVSQSVIPGYLRDGSGLLVSDALNLVMSCLDPKNGRT